MTIETCLRRRSKTVNSSDTKVGARPQKARRAATVDGGRSACGHHRSVASRAQSWPRRAPDRQVSGDESVPVFGLTGCQESLETGSFLVSQRGRKPIVLTASANNRWLAGLPQAV